MSTSSDLPRSDTDHIIRSLFGLAPSGVCPANAVTSDCGALLPHPFTLTVNNGGIFSVALSVSSHFPDVIWHFVLRSPDFPPIKNLLPAIV